MSRTVWAYQRLDDSETYSDVEHYNSSDPDIDHPDTAEFDDPERRRQIEKGLLRKLDLRVAFLVLVYIMNYMDRNNVAAARLKGLEEDLGMTGGQFNTLVSVLYVGYVLAQIPSNMFLDRLTRPSVYISFCIFLWGVFSISTGAAQSFHAALVSRLFLGLSEAVFYPGILFMLSRWYKRDELGLRMAYFTCGSSIANAFGALTASGILSTMDNRLGYAAWRWLFFIEGSLTCILSAMAFYIVPDFPSTPVSWLTTEERMLAQQRLEEDLSGVERDSSKNRSGLVEAFTDWTVWWLAIALTALNASLSFGNFFPTLAATMGFGPTITLLLCAPPWIVGVATSFLVMRSVLWPTLSVFVLRTLTDTRIPSRIVSGTLLVRSRRVSLVSSLQSRR
ncbi:Anion:Cation symporter family protein [Scleroderma yunnanense]